MFYDNIQYLHTLLLCTIFLQFFRCLLILSFAVALTSQFSVGHKYRLLTHFMPLVSFDNPWKKLENLWFFLCFQRVSKETSDMKWVKEIITNRLFDFLIFRSIFSCTFMLVYIKVRENFLSHLLQLTFMMAKF